MTITLYHYLAVSVLLFGIGLFGILTRRNAIGILMGIELILNSVNLNLVAFSRFITPKAMTGQVFALFVIAVAAGEAALGLAIVLSIYRSRNTVNIDDINLMKW
jgi:NAD(P)H-quinone oxidoreductase subunit 4L